MKDFLLDEDNDLADLDGDISTGDSDIQNQSLLLILAKGSIKQHPTACVGANNYLESEDPAGLLREIKLQYTADGMEVNVVKFEGDKLKIKANYK